MKALHWQRHPHVRSGDQLTTGERWADRIKHGLGSWPFLGIQTVFVVAWIVLNLVAWGFHWDPYPFILLNLAFSTQAAYAAPILQLSNNRADQQAGELALSSYNNGVVVRTLLERNTALTEQVANLTAIQMEILRRLDPATSPAAPATPALPPEVPGGR